MRIRFRGNVLGFMLRVDVMVTDGENYFVGWYIKCVTEMIHNLTVTLPGFCKRNICLSSIAVIQGFYTCQMTLKQWT